MAITAIRTAIIYLFLIASLRVTGKRQLGELQPIELVVTLMISDLASVPMQESGTPLLSGLIPIAVLVSLELILSVLMMKSNRLSRLISGNPVVLINDGKLSQKALRQLRLTVEDLMETLRQQDVFDLREIRYAIAETNGSMSLFKYADCQTATVRDLKKKPGHSGAMVPIVNDGSLVEWGMQMMGVTKDWVQEILDKHSCPLSQTLLLTTDDKRQTYLIRKGEDGS